MLIRFLTAATFVAAVLAPSGSAEAAPGVVISDANPYSFAVSWVTRTPRRGSVDVFVGKKWFRINDERGNVQSTSHLIAVPCTVVVRKCKVTLAPQTSYDVWVHGAPRGSPTLHVRTTPMMAPMRPLAAVGGHVSSANHHPVRDALVYVTVHHGGQTSLPLATLTLSNGGWLVTLANAVTPSGAAFPLSKGDTLSIQVSDGTGSATTSAKITSLDQPMLLKQDLVVR